MEKETIEVIINGCFTLAGTVVTSYFTYKAARSRIPESPRSVEQRTDPHDERQPDVRTRWTKMAAVVTGLLTLAFLGLWAVGRSPARVIIDKVSPIELPAVTANTKWDVAAYDDNGRRGGFGGPPYWEFHPNGVVNAGNLWEGSWSSVSGSNTIRVVLGNDDEFLVVFTSPNEFIARKAGKPYRFGRRVLQGAVR